MTSFVPVQLPSDDVDSLPYAELRKIAKQLGIKANQKAEKIRSEIKLRCLRSSETPKSKEHVVQDACISEYIHSPRNHEMAPPGECTLKSSASKLALANVTKRTAPVTSSARNSSEDEDEFASLSEDTSSSNSHVLNRTYELVEPTMLVQPPRISDEITSEPKVCLPQSTASTSAQPTVATTALSCTSSQFPLHKRGEERGMSGVPVKLPSSSKPSSGVRNVPDFSRLHAAAASRMESLVEYADRRQQQRHQTAVFSQLKSPGQPLRRNTIPHQPVALADVSNRPVSRKSSFSSSSASSLSTKDSGGRLVSRSNSVSVSDQKRSSTERRRPSTTNTAAASAFSRRKAYDLANRRHRLSGNLSTRAPTANLGPKEVAGGGQCRHQSMVTLDKQRRRTEVAAQQQRSRADARQAVADARRGLLPVL